MLQSQRAGGGEGTLLKSNSLGSEHLICDFWIKAPVLPEGVLCSSVPTFGHLKRSPGGIEERRWLNRTWQTFVVITSHGRGELNPSSFGVDLIVELRFHNIPLTLVQQRIPTLY